MERWYRIGGTRVQVYGWDVPRMDSAAALAVELHERGASRSEPFQLTGERAFLEAGPLGPGRALASGLRRHCLRLVAPRLAEYVRLSWLIERLFRCPLPLAAAVVWRAGLPRHQLLLTRWLEEHQPLDRFLAAVPAGHAERGALLDELAAELARLHALRFVHGHLAPAKVLVGPVTAPRRMALLGCRRATTRALLRGPAHDLASLFQGSRTLLEQNERARFLETYAHQRAVQGRPVDLRALGREISA